jgi:RNA polymerase sigma-70 factor (ECF subfamily)
MDTPSPSETVGITDSALTEERRLVAEVLAKDRKATAAFVELCTNWVYPFVRRRLIPRVEPAEDMTQEILLAAWQALPGFRGEANLRSWILGIARHKVEDYYRRRIRELEISGDDEPVPEPSVTPKLEQQLDFGAQQEQIHKLLEELPEAYALALMWRYRDEKSLREMAQLTGKTEKAMERLLARAREDFRRRWSDAGSRA